MNANGVGSKFEAMTILVNRAEIVLGQEGKTTYGLESVVKAEAVFTAGIGNADDVSGSIQRTIGATEVNAVVFIQQFLEERMAIPTGHQASRDLSWGLKSRHCVVLQEGVKRLDYLHIGIHINAALVIECVQAHHIRYESELAGIIRLAHVRIHIKVEVIFVPLFYLVIGAILFPRFYTFQRQFGHLATAEPAVMNYFGYHKLIYFALDKACLT